MRAHPLEQNGIAVSSLLMAWNQQLRGPTVQIWFLCYFSPNLWGLGESCVALWEHSSMHLWSWSGLCLPGGWHSWVLGDWSCRFCRVEGRLEGIDHIAKNNAPQKNALNYGKIWGWGSIGHWSRIFCQHLWCGLSLGKNALTTQCVAT